jgi:DNA-binding GntR family transcriptional regulator
MIVAGRIGHAEVQRDLIQERWLGQGHAARSKVCSHFEHEPPLADRHAGGIEQWTALVAAVGIELESLDRGGAGGVDALQLHTHAGGRAAVGGVENVGAEVAHGGRANGVACGVWAKCIQFCTHHQARTVPRRTPPPLSLPATPGAASSTDRIVQGITRAIVERRLMPGTKLVEQQIADIFDVSRTVVRQALNRLSRDRLVTLEPGRGAFVARPSVDEARQVFAVRRLVEVGMVRELAATVTPAQVRALQSHLDAERAAVGRIDVPGRTRLLADFHVVLAQMLGNAVLAELVTDLLSRSQLISLMYQSAHSAEQSQHEHVAIVEALARGDAEAAAALMTAHLASVERNLQLDPRTPDLAAVLRPVSA